MSVNTGGGSVQQAQRRRANKCYLSFAKSSSVLSSCDRESQGNKKVVVSFWTAAGWRRVFMWSSKAWTIHRCILHLVFTETQREVRIQTDMIKCESLRVECLQRAFKTRFTLEIVTQVLELMHLWQFTESCRSMGPNISDVTRLSKWTTSPLWGYIK